MTWGHCESCYFHVNRRGSCPLGSTRNEPCEVFRPAKVRRRPKGGSCTSAGDPGAGEGSLGPTKNLLFFFFHYYHHDKETCLS